MPTKSELRKLAKELRKTFDIKTVSDAILQVFLNTEEYKKSKSIALYYPYSLELDITPVFNDKSKLFFLPKINDNEDMVFCPYKLGDTLDSGKYGIKEPVTLPCDISNIDLMVLPALAVDDRGFRLGYGKGYYDKFLSESGFAGKKVVLIADDLLIKSMPNDENDVPVDIVITEKRVLKLL